MPNVDMIEEILYRLPVKSVCRFKCVSKRWLHLTTQPDFIETHLNRTQKQKLIYGYNKSLLSLDHEAAIDDGNMVPSELDFPLKGRPGIRAQNNMLGSCNGLVCIMPQPEALFIFNPCTGESMKVPDSPPVKNPNGTVLYSFGYAPSVKDYKLVKVLLNQNMSGQNNMLMFSLKNKSWKVQDLPDEYKYCSRWTNWAPLNGAVHWLLGDIKDTEDTEYTEYTEYTEDSEDIDDSEDEDIECVDEDRPFIGALDLADGEFSDLPLPESFASSDFTTGVLRGCLCLLEKIGIGLEYSCWVMEKYGVKESWTRIRFLVQHSEYMIRFLAQQSWYIFGVKPICYWKNTEELLVISSGKLVRLTDPRDGTYYIDHLGGNFYIPNFMSRSNFDVYVESLVSPNFSNIGQSEILRSSEVGMPSLSNKIIEEILSRLPVESVCRFKCVSKRWLHLTTQPHFIETHLNRTQKQKLIFSFNNSLASLDHEGAIFDYQEGRMVLDPSELDFPLKGHPGTRVEIEMFGSCNGLVCIMPQPEALFIFNPCTGESTRVPDSPPTKNPNAAVLYSFGYAPSVKDYKLVKIILAQNIVLMFSLKNKSWKRVQGLNNKYMDYSIWKNWGPLNGAVHWLLEATECVDEDSPFIGALDLADGKFSDLPLPESFASSDFTTGVLRGRLCLLEKIDTGLEYSCWVMETYGVKESWSRIRFLSSVSEYIFSVKPICYWKNTEELLVRNGRKLVPLENPEDHIDYSVDSLKGNLYFPKLWAFSNFDVYVESLVSPNFQDE